MIKFFKKFKEKTTDKWHCELNEKGGVYCAWHKNPFHKHLHWGILLILLVVFVPSFYSYYRKVSAAAPTTLAFDNKNARGESVLGQVEFLDSAGFVLGSGRTKNLIETNLPSDQKIPKLRFIPDNQVVSFIEFDNVSPILIEAEPPSAQGSAQSEDKANKNNNPSNTLSPKANLAIRFDEPPTPPGWNKVIAIGDVEGFTFTTGRLKKVAQGKDLFKCLAWDYENQKCNGRWKKITDVVPGQEYTIEFTPGDPGYGESSRRVNVLNKLLELFDYTETINSMEGTSVTLTPAVTEIAPPAQIITVNEINTENPSNDLIIDVVKTVVETIGSVVKEFFSVDTTNLAATETKITQIARSHKLLSCLKYVDNVCGRWKKEKDLIPDTDFDVTLTASPGLSVFGQARDGILVLDQNFEVIPSTQSLEKTSTQDIISIQMIDMNPQKITTYLDQATGQTFDEIIIDTTENTLETSDKKIITLGSMEASEADISATAVGWDLFQCSDFDFETQACKGKYKKTKDLIKDQSYSFNIKKDLKTREFFESKKNITVLNKMDELIEYQEMTSVDSDGDSIVTITPEDPEHPIDKIKITNSNSSLGNDLKIESTIIDDEPFLQGYAIDPTQINAEAIELELKAKGNTLYKCKDWDFALNTCLGTWEKYKNLSPGEIYTLPIDSQDPGFMEVNETAPALTSTPTSAPASAPQPVSSSGGGGSGGGGGIVFLLPAPSFSSSTSNNIISSTPTTTNNIIASNLESTLDSSIKTVSKVSSTDNFLDRVLAFNTDNSQIALPTSSNADKKPLKTKISNIKMLTSLNHGMGFNYIGEEVKVLQKFLNSIGIIVSPTGTGSPGKETRRYGPRTIDAVARFQLKYGLATPLDPGFGYLGPETRAKVNELISSY